MTEPVIVGVDSSGRSLRALVWASHEAALRGAPLRVVHVLPTWEHDIPFHPPGMWRTVRDRGADIVAEAAAMAKENYPDLDVSPELIIGRPPKVFVDASAHASAIVLGARGEGGLGNVLLGSVSLQVAGHAAAPVVVVGYVNSGHDRVLVGTDGSETSSAALAYAFEEASLRRAALHVLQTWGMPMPTEPSAEEPDPEQMAARYRRELDEQLAGLRARHPDVKVQEELLRSWPSLELIRASERSDLVVVGSRGKGGFHGLALGSVSHALLQYAMCPVAVVSPRSGAVGGA
ncbi:universal stress protein [Streptomyces sp. FH025]|uniref:universal stress protein n=1 Tax=Streptomyces sp. FH025 TaxID=2815937 RepID=UPI001A9D4C3D|nr:universal stress protein [Streptomyces sp. FH025]MBO1414073.1 universal stress protein [Streptomyces sp. FH025]